MQHVSIKIISSPVVIFCFMLLLSFSAKADSVLITSPYIGTTEEWFYEYYASKYTGTYSTEEIMTIYRDLISECPFVYAVQINDNFRQILFLPSSTTSISYSTGGIAMCHTYTSLYEPNVYIMQFSDNSLSAYAKYTAGNYTINGNSYDLTNYSEEKIYGSVGNPGYHFYIGSYYNAAFGYPLYVNSDLSTFDYQRKWCTLARNIVTAKEVDIDMYLSSEDTLQTFWNTSLSSGYDDMILTYHLNSVNQFGVKYEYTYTFSDYDLACNAGENQTVVVGDSYQGFISNISYLTAGAPSNTVNLYISQVDISFASDSGTAYYVYKDELYLIIGDESLIDTSPPDIDYDDEYTGPDHDYNTGISSDDIYDKYNIVSISGDDLSELPDWADIGYICPSISNIDYSFAGLKYQPAGDDLILHMPYLDMASIDKELSVDQFAMYFYYDALSAYSSSYDVVVFPQMSVEGEDTYICALQVFVTERFYKRQVCNNLTDGFSMMSDYLYDLSEQNNALYKVLYSSLSDSSSPIVQLKNNSITEVATLNAILTGINNLAPLQNWEPYDDTDVLQWMSDTYSLLEAQDFGTKLDAIINALNGTSNFDSTDILNKLDEVITAIENIEVSISQTVIQEEEDGILDFILDILKELITSIIKVATKLLSFILDVCLTFIDDILDLFDYMSWLFTDAVSLDNDYMLYFEPEDDESKELIDGAFVYLSLFSLVITSLPQDVIMLILLGFVITGLFIVMRRF